MGLGAIWSKGATVEVHELHQSSLKIYCYAEPVDVWSTGSAVKTNGSGALTQLNAEYATLSIEGASRAIRAGRGGRVAMMVYTSFGGVMNLTSGVDGALAVEDGNSEIRVIHDLPQVTAPSSRDFTVNGDRSFHQISELTMGRHFHDPLYGHVYRAGDVT